MSVTVVKDKGVTVITMAIDSQSLSPPLCHILKMLCCSQMCCSVNKGLMQSDVTAALGAIQIMVGLFSIGLGVGVTYTHSDYLTFSGDGYWPCGMAIFTGIMSFLAVQIPSLCSVGLAVVVNMAGSVSAMIDIVLSAVQLAPAFRMCDGYTAERHGDNCAYVTYYLQQLLIAVNISMIIMAVLQLGLCISVAALGIKAMANRKKEESEDVEDEHPQLKEVLLISPGVKNAFN